MLVLLKILGDRRMLNAELWDSVYKDIDLLVLNQEFELNEIGMVLDCIYKSGQLQFSTH